MVIRFIYGLFSRLTPSLPLFGLLDNDAYNVKKELWKCVWYFAGYPFLLRGVGKQVEWVKEEGEILSFQELTRAVVWLSGREREVFVTKGKGCNAEKGEFEIGRGRTAGMGHELIWRCLGYACSPLRFILLENEKEKRVRNERGTNDGKSNKEEILDILVETQPLLSAKTGLLPRRVFEDSAERLASPQISLSEITIPKEKLVELLDFFVAMLDWVMKASGSSNPVGKLGFRLKDLSTSLSKQSESLITYDEFGGLKAGAKFDKYPFSYVEDAFALLFNSFLCNKNVGCADRFEKQVEVFDLWSLRPESERWESQF